jgi:hypothetical protein
LPEPHHRFAGQLALKNCADGIVAALLVNGLATRAGTVDDQAHAPVPAPNPVDDPADRIAL